MQRTFGLSSFLRFPPFLFFLLFHLFGTPLSEGVSLPCLPVSFFFFFFYFPRWRCAAREVNPTVAKTGRKDHYFVSTQAGSVSRCRCFCLVLSGTVQIQLYGRHLGSQFPLLPPSYLVFFSPSTPLPSLSSSRYHSVSCGLWHCHSFSPLKSYVPFLLVNRRGPDERPGRVAWTSGLDERPRRASRPTGRAVGQGLPPLPAASPDGAMVPRPARLLPLASPFVPTLPLSPPPPPPPRSQELELEEIVGR